MKRVRAGDLDALGILFERHHTGLHRHFYWMTGRTDAAEDLMQATFERMLRYRASFRGGSFLAWMYRIAANLVSDHRRRQEAERNTSELPEQAVPAHDAPLALDMQVLRTALFRLAPGDREVLLLTKYQGLRGKEAAAVLGCSVAAVKVRVHRALKRLRTLHEELLQE